MPRKQHRIKSTLLKEFLSKENLPLKAQVILFDGKTVLVKELGLKDGLLTGKTMAQKPVKLTLALIDELVYDEVEN